MLQDLAGTISYAEVQERRAQAAFAAEPWARMILRTAIRGSTPPEGVDPLPVLRELAASPMAEVAARELERLVRNIAHEYSHTLRMRHWPQEEGHGFGPARRYTIADFLVFEGLAENLVEQFHVHPAFPARTVADDVAQRFWEAVEPHRGLANWDAHRVLMNPAPDLPDGIGYAMSYHVVRRFLDRTGMTALEAQHLPYEAFVPYIGG